MAPRGDIATETQVNRMEPFIAIAVYLLQLAAVVPGDACNDFGKQPTCVAQGRPINASTGGLYDFIVDAAHRPPVTRIGPR